MKKHILPLFFICQFLAPCYALGPYTIELDGVRFIKNNEKQQQNSTTAEYLPANKNSSASIVITHVQDKNSPHKIATGLKSKKSVEVIDIENINNADVMVSFVKFDIPNLKVQNNLCRIKASPNKNGSIVFQYIDTQKMKNQSEGAALPDFEKLGESLKQLPIDQYIATASQTREYKETSETKENRIFNREGNGNIPWYKRPGARTGAAVYHDYPPRANHPNRWYRDRY